MLRLLRRLPATVHQGQLLIVVGVFGCQLKPTYRLYKWLLSISGIGPNRELPDARWAEIAADPKRKACTIWRPPNPGWPHYVVGSFVGFCVFNLMLNQHFAFILQKMAQLLGDCVFSGQDVTDPDSMLRK